MTYTVLLETLNHNQSINQSIANGYTHKFTSNTEWLQIRAILDYAARYKFHICMYVCMYSTRSFMLTRKQCETPT